MTGKRADTFLTLMWSIEHFTLNRALKGLTDEEFFFEPTPQTWSVRRREECRTNSPFGAGPWVADFAMPEPQPVPMTSIAWLAWHIGSVPGRLAELDVFGGAHTMASGWTSPYLTHHEMFTGAEPAVAALRSGWDRLRAAVQDASDDQLERESPFYAYAQAPMKDGLCALGTASGPPLAAATFVAAVLNEVGHHGTQICVLRDLFAARTQ